MTTSALTGVNTVTSVLRRLQLQPVLGALRSGTLALPCSQLAAAQALALEGLQPGRSQRGSSSLLAGRLIYL